MVILGPTYYHCVSQEKNSFKYVKRTKSVSFDFFLEYPSLLEKKKKNKKVSYVLVISSVFTWSMKGFLAMTRRILFLLKVTA